MEYTEEMQDYVDTVITRAGSDIHLISNTKPLFRVKRELVPFIQKEALTKENTMAFAAIILKSNPAQTAARIYEQKHILTSYQHTSRTGKNVNFRVNIYLERNAVAIAMRLIEETERTIDELGLPPILKSVMQEPHGLFLVVGPAGNGKSTTLASMINHCNNTRRRHILSPLKIPLNSSLKTKNQSSPSGKYPLTHRHSAQV